MSLKMRFVKLCTRRCVLEVHDDIGLRSLNIESFSIPFPDDWGLSILDASTVNALLLVGPIDEIILRMPRGLQ